MFLEYYQKVDLAEDLRKVGEIEAKDRKGMRLLHELTKIASINCPGKVDRLYWIKIYWFWSGMIMSEDLKQFELDALEVFRILRKWKKKLKRTIKN